MALLATLIKASSFLFAVWITRQLMLSGARTFVSLIGGYFLGTFASFVYLTLALLFMYGPDRATAAVGSALGTSVSYSFFGMLLGYFLSNEKAKQIRQAKQSSITEHASIEERTDPAAPKLGPKRTEAIMSVLASRFNEMQKSVNSYAAVGIVVILGALAAWSLVGPKNFQECMDDGVTGRSAAELSYKREACYSRFPVLPKTASGKDAVLSCIENSSHEHITFTIGDTPLMNKLQMKLVSRDRSEVVFEAKNVGDDDDENVLIKIDPLRGNLKAYVTKEGKSGDVRYEFTCKGES